MKLTKQDLKVQLIGVLPYEVHSVIEERAQTFDHRVIKELPVEFFIDCIDQVISKENETISPNHPAKSKAVAYKERLIEECLWCKGKFIELEDHVEKQEEITADEDFEDIFAIDIENQRKFEAYKEIHGSIMTKRPIRKETELFYAVTGQTEMDLELALTQPVYIIADSRLKADAIDREGNKYDIVWDKPAEITKI